MNSWRTWKTSKKKNTFQQGLWFTGFSVRPYTWWVGGCQHLSFCGLVHQKSTPPKIVTVLRLWPMRIWPKYWNSLWWPWNGRFVGGEDVRLVEMGRRCPSFISIQKLVANTSDYSQMHILRIHWIDKCIICTREAAKKQQNVKSLIRLSPIGNGAVL